MSLSCLPEKTKNEGRKLRNVVLFPFPWRSEVFAFVLAKGLGEEPFFWARGGKHHPNERKVFQTHKPTKVAMASFLFKKIRAILVGVSFLCRPSQPKPQTRKPTHSLIARQCSLGFVEKKEKQISLGFSSLALMRNLIRSCRGSEQGGGVCAASFCSCMHVMMRQTPSPFQRCNNARQTHKSTRKC